MIPDDNPGQSYYMTLKDIRRVLTENYGADTGNRLPVSEVDQVIAALKDGKTVKLREVGMYLVPEGGPGLYCAYVKEGS